ncbi:MAG: response regulator transcription factor [Bacteroidota bacterium]
MELIRILVVEHQAGASMPIRDKIDELGFETVATVPLVQALASVEAGAPDLVLLATNLQLSADSVALSEYCFQQQIPILIFNGISLLPDSKATTLFLSRPVSLMDLRNLSFAGLQYLGKGLNPTAEKGERDFFVNENYFIRKNNRLIKVPIGRMHFIQSEGNYCAIQTDNGKFMVRKTLSKMEEMLPRQRFVRAHKSYIVRLAAVEAVAQTNAEIFIKGQTIPIGRKFKESFFERLSILN